MMKKTHIILLFLMVFGISGLQAQKGKNKGGGGNMGGGGNQKVNIKIKTNDGNIKLKSNGKNDKIKIDLKNKGNGGNGNVIKLNGKGNWGNKGFIGFGGPGNSDFGHSHGKKVMWFYGPGDIYLVQGLPRRQRIIIFEQVCVRLTANIGLLFGLLGDVRIKLDTKKAKMKPSRYNQLKLEIDLLDNDLKLIEIKKKKIKMRLAKLKEEDDQGEDED